MFGVSFSFPDKLTGEKGLQMTTVSQTTLLVLVLSWELYINI